MRADLCGDTVKREIRRARLIASRRAALRKPHRRGPRLRARPAVHALDRASERLELRAAARLDLLERPRLRRALSTCKGKHTASPAAANADNSSPVVQRDVLWTNAGFSAAFCGSGVEWYDFDPSLCIANRAVHLRSEE